MVDMCEIKAVTFDVGGTLAEGRLKERMYQSLAVEHLGRLGFEVTLTDYRRATGKALEELSRVRAEGLEMRFGDFCSTILQNLRIAHDEKLLEVMRSLYLKCFPQRERAGARKVLAGLSPKYLLGAISNSMSLAPRRFLEESGMAREFKSIVIPGEIGYRKPHPRIFERALEELGVRPSEAIHVGNSIEEDIVGASSVGMYSILVSPQGLGEDVAAMPNLVVGSIAEVTKAIESLSSPELMAIKESLGDSCECCQSNGVNLFKIDPLGSDEVDNYVLLCPRCREEVMRGEFPRPRKRGKYRAIYRKSWLRIHRPKQA